MCERPSMHPRTLLAHAVCWSLMVLSMGNGSADVAANGIPLQAEAFPGVSQQAVSTAARFSHRVAQAVPAPAETSTAGSASQRELADPTLASTAAKREQLTYLVRCALPADVTVYTQQEAERFTFTGGLGLAPRWLDAPMTPREERWVSAC